MKTFKNFFIKEVTALYLVGFNLICFSSRYCSCNLHFILIFYLWSCGDLLTLLTSQMLFPNIAMRI